MARTGPYFTEQARMAAAEGRRIRAARKLVTRDGLEAFAVRTENRFAWEIRQYGGVVVLAADQLFDTAALARTAGNAVLSTLEPQSV